MKHKFEVTLFKRGSLNSVLFMNCIAYGVKPCQAGQIISNNVIVILKSKTFYLNVYVFYCRKLEDNQTPL